MRAEATDNTGLAKVEAFVDGVLLTTATTSPVEVSWDTKTVADGAHQIKITAEDTEGNKEEKTIAVQVKNVLFAIEIGNFLNENTEGWFFVSDLAGKIIDVKQFQNNDMVIFNTPEGFKAGDTYNLTRLEYEAFFGNPFRALFLTFAQAKPSNITLILDKPALPPSVGSHTLLVNFDSFSFPFNFPAVASASAITDFNGFQTMPGQRPIKAALFASPSKLIYTLTNFEDDIAPQKFIVENALAGGTDVVHLSEFTPFDFHIVPVNGSISSNAEVSIIQRPGDYFNSERLSDVTQNIDPNQIKVFTADIQPTEFLTDLSYSTGIQAFFYTKADPQVATSFKKPNADITAFSVVGKNLSMEVSGEADHVRFIGNNFDEVTFTDYTWVVFGPAGGKTQIQLPELPIEILNKYPDLENREFVFDVGSIRDYVGINGYDAWVDVRSSGKSEFNTAKEMLLMDEFFAPSGGKVGKYPVLEFLLMDKPDLKLK